MRSTSRQVGHCYMKNKKPDDMAVSSGSRKIGRASQTLTTNQTTNV